jgi:hypothetical protein
VGSKLRGNRHHGRVGRVTTPCNLSASRLKTLASASFDMSGCDAPCLSFLIKSGRCKAVVYRWTMAGIICSP